VFFSQISSFFQKKIEIWRNTVVIKVDILEFRGQKWIALPNERLETMRIDNKKEMAATSRVINGMHKGRML